MNWAQHEIAMTLNMLLFWITDDSSKLSVQFWSIYTSNKILCSTIFMLEKDIQSHQTHLTQLAAPQTASFLSKQVVIAQIYVTFTESIKVYWSSGLRRVGYEMNVTCLTTVGTKATWNFFRCTCTSAKGYKLLNYTPMNKKGCIQYKMVCVI